MKCPHCNKDIFPGQLICHHCNKVVTVEYPNEQTEEKKTKKEKK